jgi:hypothetical protein
MNRPLFTRFFATAKAPTTRDVVKKKIWNHLRESISPVPKKMVTGFTLFVAEKAGPLQEMATAWNALSEQDKTV